MRTIHRRQNKRQTKEVKLPVALTDTQQLQMENRARAHEKRKIHCKTWAGVGSETGWSLGCCRTEARARSPE
jgi:hypothetical protein